MNIDLSARTAIISGSTGGIGLAIACGLARAQGGRGQVHGVVADLGTAAGAETLFAAHPKADS